MLGRRRSTTDRAGGRTFTITATEGQVGEERVDDRRSTATCTSWRSDGLDGRRPSTRPTPSADGIVRAPGPVEFSAAGMSGSGVGMTYDKNTRHPDHPRSGRRARRARRRRRRRDATSPPAPRVRAPRQRRLRFDARRAACSASGQTIDGRHRGRASERRRGAARGARAARRVADHGVDEPRPGGLQALTGRDIDLTYAADGQTLEHAVDRRRRRRSQLAGERRPDRPADYRQHRST